MKKNILLLIAMSLLVMIAPVYADALKNISLDYCAVTGNILPYSIETNVDTGICYTITNSSDQKITMKVNFVDGTFTNDQWQNRACLDESAKENFGQYVTKYKTTITLSGGETKTETARLLYPGGTDGQYHGCITYSVVDTTNKSNTGENSNFSILMRKAKFIDVLVGHPEKITGGILLKPFTLSGNNLSSNPKIRIYQDMSDNKYVIELTVKNEASVEQDVVLTGIASNFLTYKYTFSETRKILKGQEFIITKKLEDIPNYNLDVDIALAYTPVIQGVPTQTSYIHETTRIFIINIITIATGIALLVFLIIVILLIRSLTKKRNIQPGFGPIPSTPVASPQVTPGIQNNIPSVPIVQPPQQISPPPTNI